MRDFRNIDFRRSLILYYVVMKKVDREESEEWSCTYS